ncbi:MAG: cytochrome c biogenesis protein CcsA, partial [Deltaproteobacteria bacterium]
IMFIAFLLHSVSFVIYHLYYLNIATFGTRELALSLSWLIAGIFLLFQLFTKTRLLGAFISPIVLALCAVAIFGGSTTATQFPTVGKLIVLHAIFAIGGEALFIVASLAGAVFLLQERLIKNKTKNVFIKLLPPLDDLDKINKLSILWGFPLMSAGIIIGLVYASSLWQTRIAIDAKQIWSIFVWATYAFILHQRSALGWRGHKIAQLSLVAFLISLVAFFFVINCPASLHRFI